MGLFSKRQVTPMTPRMALENRYNTARANLLLAVVFTVINLVLLIVANGETYFLFSVFVPYYVVLIGMILCGKFPAEYYGADWEGMEFFGDGLFIATLAFAVLMLVLYVLCYVLSSRGRIGWLIASLVLFSLDTVLMFALQGVALDALMDVLFHAWVIVYLAMGIHAHFKLKTLPPETTTVLPEGGTNDFDMPQ